MARVWSFSHDEVERLAAMFGACDALYRLPCTPLLLMPGPVPRGVFAETFADVSAALVGRRPDTPSLDIMDKLRRFMACSAPCLAPTPVLVTRVADFLLHECLAVTRFERHRVHVVMNAIADALAPFVRGDVAAAWAVERIRWALAWPAM